VAWVLAWAAVPVAGGLLPGAYLATVGVKPLPLRLLIGLVFAYEVVLTFWAVGRFTRERDTVQRSVDKLAAGPEQAATPVFGGMASTWGPLALTLVFVMVTVWRTTVVGDLGAALVWLPVAVLLNLPLMTAVWAYLALLVGLYRLGRRTLSLAAFPEDLSLGLGEVGRLAFTAFWIYGAGFAPVLALIGRGTGERNARRFRCREWQPERLPACACHRRAGGTGVPNRSRGCAGGCVGCGAPRRMGLHLAVHAGVR
jgi:hypothetical protein